MYETVSSMQALKDKIKADKKLVVSAKLNLTDAEAKGFWPIYESYQKDLGGINQRMAKMIKSYAEVYSTDKLDDAMAKKLVDEAISIENAEVSLKKSYVSKLNKVIPEMKIARYYQIETKIRAIVRYELANAIPLAQ